MVNKNMSYIAKLPLAELSDSEWEMLCDHCGRCCLIKLENDQTDEVFYTNIICQEYDIEKAQCAHYSIRQQSVPGCIVIRQFGDDIYSQLPDTCAYRLRHNDKPLPLWHPLIVGHTEQMREAKIYVNYRVVSEQGIHEEQFEDHIIKDIK